MNRLQAIITFQDEATTAGNGVVYQTTPVDELLTLEFSGTGTFTAVIESKIDNTWLSVSAFSITDTSYTTTINTFDKIWQIPLEGLVNIRTRLSAVDGEVSVIGRATG